MRAAVIALLLSVYSTASLAGPTPPAVRTEIDAVLARLVSSGCEFERNGSWYKAQEARTHLIRKLEYLEGKTTLASTEHFIKMAGASSSASGKAYQVRCPGKGAEPSEAWLNTELQAVRRAARP